MQKHPHITEWFACILKMLATLFLFPGNSFMHFLISLGICSTPKLSKQVRLFLLQNNAVQCVPTSVYSPRFIMYAPSFIFLGKLFLQKTPLNLGSFVSQNLLKDKAVLKITFFFIFMLIRRV